jgi:hypothetical protein
VSGRAAALRSAKPARAKDWTEIPAEITHVRVRAHDSVHNYGGKTVELDLER